MKQTFRLINAAFNAKGYYKAMNVALKHVNNEYTMLHYPYFRNESDSFLQSQKNLTDYCIDKLEPVQDKDCIEIGCGNGIQGQYILEKYNPKSYTGIDLDPSNIEIANMEKGRKKLKDINFHVDDAQNLKKINGQTFDIVINIESAFHYPDKRAFLNEISRILKPGGKFLIADLLTKKSNGSNLKGLGLKRKWKNKQVLHHWNKQQYLSEFAAANLDLIQEEDITSEVIKGFLIYKSWFRQMNIKGFYNNLIFKFFYLVNIQLNIFLLRYKRQYGIFIGVKTGS